MSELKSKVDDVDPAEWRRNLENALDVGIYKRCMSDKIRFIKEMTDGLKLTLDDIRDKSEKYSALNSVPPDVLPMKINLTNGETIVLLGVKPVITCYEDILTNVKGNIIHLYVRRKGEELPEDFLPPKRMLTIPPPPPGFVRSPLLKLFTIPTVDENHLTQPRPSTSKESDTLMNDKCEEDATVVVIKEDNTSLDEKNEKESTFKFFRQDETSGNKKHGTEIQPNIGGIEDFSVLKKHKEELKFDPIKKEDPSLPMGRDIDETNSDESVLDISSDEDILTEEKHLNESILSISDESSNLSDATSIFVIDSSSCSSTDNSDRFQILGVTEMDDSEVDLE